MPQKKQVNGVNVEQLFSKNRKLLSSSFELRINGLTVHTAVLL